MGRLCGLMSAEPTQQNQKAGQAGRCVIAAELRKTIVNAAGHAVKYGSLMA